MLCVAYMWEMGLICSKILLLSWVVCLPWQCCLVMYVRMELVIRHLTCESCVHIVYLLKLALPPYL